MEPVATCRGMSECKTRPHSFRQGERHDRPDFSGHQMGRRVS